MTSNWDCTSICSANPLAGCLEFWQQWPRQWQCNPSLRLLSYIFCRSGKDSLPMTAPPCERFHWVWPQMKKKTFRRHREIFCELQIQPSPPGSLLPSFQIRQCWHLDIPHSWKPKVLLHAENCEACGKTRNRIIEIMLLWRRVILTALDNHINTVKSTWCPVKSTLKQKKATWMAGNT